MASKAKISLVVSHLDISSLFSSPAKARYSYMNFFALAANFLCYLTEVPQETISWFKLLFGIRSIWIPCTILYPCNLKVHPHFEQAHHP